MKTSIADALARFGGAQMAVWLAHADNIARLRDGTERTFDTGMLQRD
jgi:hypothetical protein